MSPPARRLVWSLNSKPSRVSDYEFHYVRDFQNSRLTRRAPFARVRKRNPFWIPSPKPMCSVTSRAQDKFHSTAEKRSFYLMFELCRVVKKKKKTLYFDVVKILYDRGRCIECSFVLNFERYTYFFFSKHNSRK